jgi:hypothetical protein
LRWKILLLALALIVAANAITIAATPILTHCFNLFNTTTFDLKNIVLDGGGDPVPGGGIPK